MRTLPGSTRRRLQVPHVTRAVTVLLIGAGVTQASACLSIPMVANAAGAEPRADSAPPRPPPPRCYGYVLLVENAHSQPVEIYEVGPMTNRFVAVALIGITEVPMTDRAQQFVAVSSGVVMAASANSETRASDRVALLRSCRLSQ
jgi:hypothetical protein